MRFYDYKCPCGEVVEVYEKTEDSLQSHLCPICNAEMKRVISTPQFNSRRMPQGHRLSASQRKELWKSDNINDFRKIG